MTIVQSPFRPVKEQGRTPVGRDFGLPQRFAGCAASGSAQKRTSRKLQRKTQDNFNEHLPKTNRNDLKT
jgi:hypothetical protein